MATDNTVNITINNPHAQTDFDSGIRRQALPIRFMCDLDCQADAPLCSACINDQAFAYLAQQGDILYFQWNFPDIFNADPLVPVFGWDTDGTQHWLEIDLMNADGTVALAGLTLDAQALNLIPHGYGVGYYQGASYQNFSVNINSTFLAALNGPCFYFRIKICQREFVNKDLHWNIQTVTGVLPPAENYNEDDLVIVGAIMYRLQNGGWVAIVPQPIAGDYAWAVEDGQWYAFNGVSWTKDPAYVPPTVADCTNFKYCYTAPFIVRKCQQKVKFEGFPVAQPLVDCRGKYYGSTGFTQQYGRFAFQNIFCIEASLEVLCFDTERTVTDGGAILGEKMVEVSRFRAIVPEEVARRISSIFLHENMYLNGALYDEAGAVCKGNDESLDWHLDFELRKEECDTSDSDCD